MADKRKDQAELTNRLLKALGKIQPEINRDLHTDLGMAQLFCDLFSETLRYNATAKKWWMWNGIVWHEDIGESFTSECAKVLYRVLLIYISKINVDDNTRERFIDCIRKYGFYNKRRIMLEDAKPLMIVSQTEFDSNLDLFNCLNCTLNLKNMEKHEHRPSDMLSKVSGVNFDPDANSPLWDTFIDEIMQGDVEKKQYLQKIKGYTLTADTHLETGFFLFGMSTRNGKTTLEETFKAMMGEYAATVQPESLERTKNRSGSTPSPDKARLAGIRFVTVSEPPQGMILDVSQYKQWTGGNKVTARFLNENCFEYKPQFKLFFDCNHLPIVTDDTLFSSDRVRIIPFNRHFKPQEQNKNLKQLLQAPSVLSAVLNWAIKGLKDLRENGECPPDCIKEAIAKYESKSDKIRLFFDACMRPSNNNSHGASVYNAYNKWCAESGYNAEGKTLFNESLRKRGLMKCATIKGCGTDRNAVVGYELCDDVQNV